MVTIKECKDQKSWDQAVTTFSDATFFDSWTWGEYMRSMGRDMAHFLVYEEKDVIGAIPVWSVKALRGKYLHIRHMPFSKWGDGKASEKVLSFLKKYARQKGADFIRISPLVKDSPENRELFKQLGFVSASSHAVDAENTLVLDLTKSEEDLMREMRKNTRYYIRKAEKIGVSVVSTVGMEMFDSFWEIYAESVKRNRWTAYPKSAIQNEYELFSKNGMARMFLSVYKGTPIAASIFVYFNGHSVYHHSGSLTQYRDIPSAYLLQWEAIKHAKSMGMKLHNLWGVSPEDDKTHPWYGLSLFKRGFGGQEVDMLHAQDLILNRFAHLTRTYEYVERWWNGYA